jgi:hypothetical protein
MPDMYRGRVEGVPIYGALLPLPASFVVARENFIHIEVGDVKEGYPFEYSGNGVRLIRPWGN